MVLVTEGVTEELYRRERASGFTFFGPWAVGNGDVESGKQQNPPGLPGVKVLGCTEILKPVKDRQNTAPFGGIACP
jgi:hypothetical protein